MADGFKKHGLLTRSIGFIEENSHGDDRHWEHIALAMPGSKHFKGPKLHDEKFHGRHRSRRAAAGRAQLLAKGGSIGQMQISAELIIRYQFRMRPDASGRVRMRPDASRMRRDASGF